MDRRNSKAAIIIGDYDYGYEVYNEEWDIYFFPNNVSEWELAEEIAHLVEFYDILDYPTDWPPHLRKEKVIAWINGQ